MKKLFTIVLFATVLVPLVMAQSLTMTTVAGKIPAGDGGLASSIYLLNPEAVTMDKAGNYYIADTGDHRVFKVDGTTGVATLLAGDGFGHTSGDNGPSNKAGIGLPSGLALDAAGNLYIADRNQHRIRKIDTTGKITTIAGFGDGRFTGDGRAATLADLNGPRGIAVDSSGSIYFADTGNHRIRKIDAAGNISTVVGTASGYDGDGGPAKNARLNAPEDLVFDADGNMYIADTGNSRIRVVNKQGIIETFAGSGDIGNGGDGFRAILADFNQPAGVKIDKDGNIVVADRGNDRIRVIRPDGNMIRTLVAPAQVTSGFKTPGIRSPARIYVDPSSGVILIPESGATPSKPTGSTGSSPKATPTNYISKYDPARGLVSVIAGARRFAQSGNIATQSVLSNVWGVAVDRAGNVFFSEPNNHRVMKVDKNGILYNWAGTGVSGNIGDGGIGSAARLNNPRGLAVDAIGNLYIADAGNNKIRMVTPGGIITTVVGTGSSGYTGDGGLATDAKLKGPQGVCTDGFGNLYVSDTGNNAVRKVVLSGTIRTVAGGNGSGFAGDGGAAVDANLNSPQDVSVDDTGTKLYIADSGNASVRLVENGIIVSFAGVTNTSGDNATGANSWLRRMRSGLVGVTVDSAGNVYNTDTNNNVVRKTDTKFAATNFAGTVTNNSNADLSYNGDGPASSRISQPAGLTMDSNDNLYIADQWNGLIRKVATKGQ